MLDYSEGLIRIQELRRDAQLATLKKDWAKACDCMDEIVLTAARLKIFCADELNEKLGELASGRNNTGL